MKKPSSQTLRSIVRLVVDANPIISALIGGAASRVFAESHIEEFATAEFTLGEVTKYLPRLAQKAEAEEAVLLLDLQLLPLKIYSRDFYSSRWKEAENRIGTRDPNDVDLLALALKLRVPIWSNDPDFQSARVRLYTTAELLKILEAKPE